MKASLRLACLMSASMCVVSCGSDSGPTAPSVDPVEYVVSAAANSVEASFWVDDELRLFVNGQSVGSWGYGVARFQARPGDTLRVQAVDTCQGQYYLSELWIRRSGIGPAQITPGITTCSLSSVPCLLPADCGAPDRVFYDVSYTLP
jgi:hypothetical protein